MTSSSSKNYSAEEFLAVKGAENRKKLPRNREYVVFSGEELYQRDFY